VAAARAEPPAPLAALAEEARTLAPEFASDALIRIGSSVKVEDQAWQAELLEEAFGRAAGAQFALKRGAMGVPRDQTAFVWRASQQEMDILSLQVRAVGALLNLDKKRARALFEQMAPPRIPKVGCEESLVYDVDALYPLVARVVKETFSAQEIEDERALGVIQRYLAAMNSAVAVVPAAAMLASLDLPTAQWQAAVLAFTAAVRELGGDDRAFTQARAAGGRIKELVNACKKREVSPAPVVEAYRFFLVRHLIGARCEDSAGLLPQMQLSPFVDAAKSQSAEEYFASELATEAAPKLREQEVTPSKVEGKAKDRAGCESPECRALARQYRDLVFGPMGMAWSGTERAGAEWRAKMNQFLSALAAWHEAADGAGAGYFRDKVTFYSNLFHLVTPGPDREVVLGATLGFLRQNRFQAESRAQWFLPVNILLSLVGSNPSDYAQLWRDLKGDPDPVVAFYARLYELLPPTPPEFLKLM
jgi:hypothetical protein